MKLLSKIVFLSLTIARLSYSMDTPVKKNTQKKEPALKTLEEIKRDALQIKYLGNDLARITENNKNYLVHMNTNTTDYFIVEINKRNIK